MTNNVVVTCDGPSCLKSEPEVNYEDDEHEAWEAETEKWEWLYLTVWPNGFKHYLHFCSRPCLALWLKEDQP